MGTLRYVRISIYRRLIGLPAHAEEDVSTSNRVQGVHPGVPAQEGSI